MGVPTSEVGLHSYYTQEAGPRSPQGQVVALGEKKSFVQERIKELEMKIKEKQLTVSYSCMTVKYDDSYLRAPRLIVAITPPPPLTS